MSSLVVAASSRLVAWAVTAVAVSATAVAGQLRAGPAGGLELTLHLLASVAAVGVAIRCLRRPYGPAWRWLGIGAAVWAAGQAMWALDPASTDGYAAGVWDAALLIGAALMVLSVVRLSAGPSTWAQRAAALFDGLLLAFGVLLVLAVTVFRDADPFPSFNLVYVAADVTALAIVFNGAVYDRKNRMRLRWAAGAAAVWAATDAAWIYGELVGGRDLGLVTATGWLVAWWLVFVFARSASVADDRASRRGQRPHALELLPLVATSVAAVFAIATISQRALTLFETFLTSGFTASAILRLASWWWQNRRLTDDLEEHLRQLARSEEHFRAIFDDTREVVVILDDRGVVLDANRAIERLGIPVERAVGATAVDLLAGAGRCASDTVARWLVSGAANAPLLTMDVDGREVTLEAEASDLRDNPAVGGVVVHLRDVTERVHGERALRQAQERFRASFEEAAIGMVLYDLQGVVLHANKAMARMLGWSPGELDGHNVRELVAPNDLIEAEAHFSARAEGDDSEAERLEVRLVRRDGSSLWAELHVAYVDDADGARYPVAQYQDITERKAATAALAHAAMHDRLTGLPNREQFERALDAALRDEPGRTGLVGVLFVDLDRFKVVNDALGHAAGDELLREVARRLRSAIRPGDLVARFGGDEFTVLVRHVSDHHALLDVAARVLDVVNVPASLSTGESLVSASIGAAAAAPGTGASAEGLLRDADAAMYRAKMLGRSRAELFDEGSRDQLTSTLRTGNELYRALDRGEIVVHYQPLVDIATGGIHGVEALARWAHPERGLLGPGAFIELAEDTGLVVPLGNHVLAEACRQAARWADEGALVPRVSVNVSARQLSDDQLRDHVERALERSGLDPDRLWLEVTETALMSNTATAIAALRSVRELGVHVSIDDFGTGYASLTYAKRFPVEALKIDRSFVSGLGHDPGDTAIVGAVVGLAHALGLTAIAEGVERDDQVVLLRELGCDVAQGFLFARPRPPEELERRLRAQDRLVPAPLA